MSTVLALLADDAYRELLDWSLVGADRDVLRSGDPRELEQSLGRGGVDVVVVDREQIDAAALGRCLALPRIGSTEVLLLVRADALEDSAARHGGAHVDFVCCPTRAGELRERVQAALHRAERARMLEQHLAELRRERGELRRLCRDAERDRANLLEVVESQPAPRVCVRLTPNGEVAELHRATGLGLVTGTALDGQGELGARLQSVAARLRSGAPVRRMTWGGTTFDVTRLACTDGSEWLELVDVSLARKALARHARRERVETREGSSEDPVIRSFVGRAPQVRKLAERVARLRDGRSTVLVQGESGTGKELIARGLHFGGVHAQRPFVPIHCGAISRDLIESELFGYEKGAFTGAHASQVGLFEAADGGTVFLDEVGETSLAVQVKLLRVLQTGEIRPVGATQPRFVDVRIIAATNNDLWQQVADGTFREDLFYRLHVVDLCVPPLRDRREDLPRLIDHFVRRFNRRRPGPPVRGVSREVLALFEAYPWPGNVRELENALDAAFALGVGEVIQVEDLPRRIRDGAGASLRPVSGRSARPLADERAIRDALRRAGGDKARAAELLGISRATLYRRLRESEAGG